VDAEFSNGVDHCLDVLRRDVVNGGAVHHDTPATLACVVDELPDMAFYLVGCAHTEQALRHVAGDARDISDALLCFGHIVVSKPHTVLPLGTSRPTSGRVVWRAGSEPAVRFGHIGECIQLGDGGEFARDAGKEVVAEEE